MQLHPLGSVEIGKHRTLKLIALQAQLAKEGTPRHGERDPMAPAVNWINASFDQAARFEQIDDADSIPGIDADDGGKALLRSHADLRQRHEHPIVRRPEAMFGQTYLYLATSPAVEAVSGAYGHLC